MDLAPVGIPLLPITNFEELIFRKSCHSDLYVDRTWGELAIATFTHLTLLCGIVLLLYYLFYGDETDAEIPIKLELEDQALLRQLAPEVLEGHRLKLAHITPAFTVDWNAEDPVRFDPNYMDDLYQRQDNHRDLITNNQLEEKTKNQFLKLINDLTNNATIKDHYDLELSQENVNRLRKMVTGIVNLLNAARIEPKFEELYATIVGQICIAMDNCSNRINSEIERLFYGLLLPKDGTINLRVAIALQEFRLKLFNKVLHDLLKEPENEYYLDHEASSFNYYSGRMSRQFGLPPSISALDSRWQGFALKDKEQELYLRFRRAYTPKAIIDEIFKIVQDPLDSTITAAQFTEWLLNRYTNGETFYDEQQDGSYLYMRHTVVDLLKELNILAPL